MATEAKAEATFSEIHPDPEDARREHARQGVQIDVTLGAEHNFYAGFAENLSAGGIFIATHVEKKIGELMAFSISLPEIDSEIKGVGEVRWVREYSETSDVSPGLGLRFVSLVDGALVRIREFLGARDPLFFDDEE